MEEAIFAELTADPTLAAKLTAGGSRYHLYPLRVPEGVHIAQAVTFTEITQSLTYPLLRTSVFQFTCIGNTFDKARNLADDIDRIFTIQGAYQLGNSFPVQFVQMQNRTSLYDEEAKLYLVAVDVFFKF